MRKLGVSRRTEAAGRAVLAVERLLGHMGISPAFDDYGISRDDVPRMATRAAKQARLLGTNTRAIGRRTISSRSSGGGSDRRADKIDFCDQKKQAAHAPRDFLHLSLSND